MNYSIQNQRLLNSKERTKTMTLINNVVIRPPKPLNDLQQLTPRQLKQIEIDNLEKKIRILQDQVELMKTEISYYPEKAEGRIWLKDIMIAVCNHMNFTKTKNMRSKVCRDIE